MLNRIIDSFCHPSRLGLYYKDKWYLPLCHLLAMVAIMLIACYVSGINKSYFTKDDCSFVYNLVLKSDDEFDLSFESNTLSGHEAKITSPEYDAIFLGDIEAPKNNESKMTMSFDKNSVRIYLGKDLLNTYEYSRANPKSFTFSELRNYDLKAKMAFYELLMGAFMSVNSQFVNIDITSGVVTYILTYAFLLLVIVAFSYMSNPDLTLPIRIRICIYASLIYFLLIFFKVCLNIKMLEYLALILPVFYVNSAFRRIIRIRINKN